MIPRQSSLIFDMVRSRYRRMACTSSTVLSLPWPAAVLNKTLAFRVLYSYLITQNAIQFFTSQRNCPKPKERSEKKKRHLSDVIGVISIHFHTSDSEDSGLAAVRAEERRRRRELLGDAECAAFRVCCAFRASAAFFSRSRARRSVPGREAFLAACGFARGPKKDKGKRLKCPNTVFPSVSSFPVPVQWLICASTTSIIQSLVSCNHF